MPLSRRTFLGLMGGAAVLPMLAQLPALPEQLPAVRELTPTAMPQMGLSMFDLAPPAKVIQPFLVQLSTRLPRRAPVGSVHIDPVAQLVHVFTGDEVGDSHAAG